MRIAGVPDLARVGVAMDAITLVATARSDAGSTSA
jgi:hypothetical protein